MALQITKMDDAGNSATYFNIQELTLAKNGALAVKVYGYKDNQTRLDSMEPMFNMYFTAQDGDTVSWTEAYAVLKANDYFDGAMDV